jgi:hypothetical protein
MVVFVPASGRPFSVIRTLSGYQPALVSHTVSLTARLDADGYSQASIISILAAGRVMIPSRLSLVPFSPAQRAAMEAIAEVERRRSRGAVFTPYPYTRRNIIADMFRRLGVE